MTNTSTVSSPTHADVVWDRRS